MISYVLQWKGGCLSREAESQVKRCAEGLIHVLNWLGLTEDQAQIVRRFALSHQEQGLFRKHPLSPTTR